MCSYAADFSTRLRLDDNNCRGNCRCCKGFLWHRMRKIRITRLGARAALSALLLLLPVCALATATAVATIAITTLAFAPFAAITGKA